MHANCAKSMHINTAVLHSTCIYAKKKNCSITQYVHLLRKIHAEPMYKQCVDVYAHTAYLDACILKCCTFECAYIHKCIYSHTDVCVCDQASIHDGGGGCWGVRPAADGIAVASVEVGFVSPQCTPPCRLLQSAYTCADSHTCTCVCVCVCVCTDTHKSRWKAVTRRRVLPA